MRVEVDEPENKQTAHGPLKLGDEYWRLGGLQQILSRIDVCYITRYAYNFA
jgi:hypothetical protein